MSGETEQYLVFLSRFRRENSFSPWRAMLANPHTGEQYSFADLEKLFQFLDECLAQLDEPDADESQRRRIRAGARARQSI